MNTFFCCPLSNTQSIANASLHAHRFSKAAQHYDVHARVQKQSADHLWTWLQQRLTLHNLHGFEPKASIDVGCGTGFLTAKLLAQYPQVPCHAVDLAPGMLHHVQTSLNPHGDHLLHTHQLDGEHLALEDLWLSSQSLLVSNMCAQWFGDPLEAVRRWLSLSNVVCLSLQLDDSFEAWKQAHIEAGLPCGLRPLPHLQAVQAWPQQLMAEGLCQVAEVHSKQWLEHYANGLAFARTLKAIGADSPAATHTPVPLRRVLQHLDEGCTINHHIAYLFLKR